ncbi:MAG: hypothetical protein ACRCT1_08155 [Microcoleaceae cyanobacterium]
MFAEQKPYLFPDKQKPGFFGDAVGVTTKFSKETRFLQVSGARSRP